MPEFKLRPTVNGAGVALLGELVSPGHILDASFAWSSATTYAVLPGEAVVGSPGVLLSWSADLTRTPGTLTASSIYYVYLYSASGTPTLLESLTPPLWDRALQYYKLGGASPDASRRCVGALQTDSTGVLRQFVVTAEGRRREVYSIITATIGQLQIVSGASNASTWQEVNMAALVAAHATHFLCNSKITFAAAGDEAGVSISPIDLGAGASAQVGLHPVRDAGAKAGGKSYFGTAWVPITIPQKTYSRIQIISGLPTYDISCQGMRFSV